jgi:hypothetical protein
MFVIVLAPTRWTGSGLGARASLVACWWHLEAFEDAYRGEWARCAPTRSSGPIDIGPYHAADKAGSPYVTVDIDALERDLDIEMYTARADGFRITSSIPCLRLPLRLWRYLAALYAGAAEDGRAPPRGRCSVLAVLVR